mmetsp:Transcript_42738/g.79123  ORF Transcript_42738/g.79123 Transcript_42738/m.79123 type:complete len:208 (+) Transcript_42738:542-1165(+)
MEAQASRIPTVPLVPTRQFSLVLCFMLLEAPGRPPIPLLATRLPLVHTPIAAVRLSTWTVVASEQTEWLSLLKAGTPPSRERISSMDRGSGGMLSASPTTAERGESARKSRKSLAVSLRFSFSSAANLCISRSALTAGRSFRRKSSNLAAASSTSLHGTATIVSAIVDTVGGRALSSASYEDVADRRLPTVELELSEGYRRCVMLTS